MMIRTWCLWLILCFNAVIAGAADLTTIAVAQQGGKTSLYFTIKGTFTHKLFVLTNPSRVIVDFSGTGLAVNLNSLSLTGAVVKQVRSGHPSANILRLVFEVNQNMEARSEAWQPQGQLNGIKVDLLPARIRSNAIQAKIPVPTVSKVIIKQPQPIVAPAQAILRHQKPIMVSHSPSRQLRDVVVVLDAGHGGKDPGARGPGRSKEKDVVLAITLKLKQLIDKQPGMRAVLTRSGDYYVGLRQRLDIARKYNGDVFVSIHADAFNNPHSNGASVFALSQSGATSEAARWIAEKENYSEVGGVNLGDLDDQNGVVRSVLIDLSQTATINSGLQMGKSVLNQLDALTTLHNTKVEQARFVVLKSPDTPSILVETGFISNPREERNLTSYAYQTQLSQSIFQGIKGYFWESPPQGTRIEAMTANQKHSAWI
ncbi:MAG: N-acetylmuramoyl-L-alanine amidase [Legionellales bacterium]